ncbi:MAG TPA: hypothetical protein VFI42_08500 [Thermomicrobiaceae bacterium]|nr:hypothetical protein [Thermomicrobiaceae bacterium]
MSFDDDRSFGHLHDADVSDDGDHECHYSTSQPAPTQWVAVGVTSLLDQGDPRHRMLVGTGSSEAAAIRALRRRCRWLSAG